MALTMTINKVPKFVSLTLPWFMGKINILLLFYMYVLSWRGYGCKEILSLFWVYVVGWRGYGCTDGHYCMCVL